jgi:hypothetical protein
MTAPLPTVTEICTLPGAERHAFRDIARRLHSRADRLERLAGTRRHPAGQDLRRAACLLDAAQAGLAAFNPHPATGLRIVPRAQIERLVRAVDGLVALIDAGPCQDEREAAIAEALSAQADLLWEAE